MKTRNVFIKAVHCPVLAVIPTTSIVDTAEICLHENASCLFVSRKKRVSSSRQTAQRPTERRKRKCGEEADAEINCKMEPVAKKFLGARDLEKNEAKSENSIPRAYFVQTRPPEFNHRLSTVGRFLAGRGKNQPRIHRFIICRRFVIRASPSSGPLCVPLGSRYRRYQLRVERFSGFSRC